MNDIYRYYEILGLEPGAPPQRIKQAYHDLLWVWHPDRFANNPRLQRQAEATVKQINDAYDHLKSNANVSREPASIIMAGADAWRNGETCSVVTQPPRHNGRRFDVKIKLAAALAALMILPAIYLLRMAREVPRRQAESSQEIAAADPETRDKATGRKAGGNTVPSAAGKRVKAELCVKKTPSGVLVYDHCSVALLKQGYVRFAQAGALLEAARNDSRRLATVVQPALNLAEEDRSPERERAAKNMSAQRERFEKIKWALSEAQNRVERDRVEHKLSVDNYNRQRELYGRGAISREDVVQAEAALAQAALRLHHSRQWVVAAESMYDDARLQNRSLSAR